MHCPNTECSGPQMRVIETRYSWDKFHRRRRYRCPECKYRFTSIERIVKTIEPKAEDQTPD